MRSRLHQTLKFEKKSIRAYSVVLLGSPFRAYSAGFELIRRQSELIRQGFEFIRPTKRAYSIVVRAYSVKIRAYSASELIRSKLCKPSQRYGKVMRAYSAKMSSSSAKYWKPFVKSLFSACAKHARIYNATIDRAGAVGVLPFLPHISKSMVLICFSQKMQKSRKA